ncbi:hypothetical protein KC356_g67 [Hortaea werneckii]|nr:hypothetical protein KC356_g67 [Hortaea werneckii]
MAAGRFPAGDTSTLSMISVTTPFGAGGALIIDNGEQTWTVLHGISAIQVLKELVSFTGDSTVGPRACYALSATQACLSPTLHLLTAAVAASSVRSYRALPSDDYATARTRRCLSPSVCSGSFCNLPSCFSCIEHNPNPNFNPILSTPSAASTSPPIPQSSPTLGSRFHGFHVCFSPEHGCNCGRYNRVQEPWSRLRFSPNAGDAAPKRFRHRYGRIWRMRSSPMASWEDKALFHSEFLGRVWQLARSWTMFMRAVVIEKLFNDALDSILHVLGGAVALYVGCGIVLVMGRVEGINIGCSIGIPVAIRLILFVSCRIARESRSILSPRSLASTSAATSRSTLLVHHPVFTVLMAYLFGHLTVDLGVRLTVGGTRTILGFLAALVEGVPSQRLLVYASAPAAFWSDAARAVGMRQQGQHWPQANSGGPVAFVTGVPVIRPCEHPSDSGPVSHRMKTCFRINGDTKVSTESPEAGFRLYVSTKAHTESPERLMPEGKRAPKVLGLAADEKEERGGGRAGRAKRSENDKDYQQVRAANDTIGNGSGAIKYKEGASRQGRRDRPSTSWAQESWCSRLAISPSTSRGIPLSRVIAVFFSGPPNPSGSIHDDITFTATATATTTSTASPTAAATVIPPLRARHLQATGLHRGTIQAVFPVGAADDVACLDQPTDVLVKFRFVVVLVGLLLSPASVA